MKGKFKMIEEKKEELVRMMRLYMIGKVDVKMVRNILHCLYIDVFLDMGVKVDDEKENFDEFIKEMSECF